MSPESTAVDRMVYHRAKNSPAYMKFQQALDDLAALRNITDSLSGAFPPGYLNTRAMAEAIGRIEEALILIDTDRLNAWKELELNKINDGWG